MTLSSRRKGAFALKMSRPYSANAKKGETFQDENEKVAGVKDVRENSTEDRKGISTVVGEEGNVRNFRAKG